MAIDAAEAFSRVSVATFGVCLVASMWLYKLGWFGVVGVSRHVSRMCDLQHINLIPRTLFVLHL